MEIDKYIVLDIETEGLTPFYGDKITCICARTQSGTEFSRAGKNEKLILQDFLDWILKYMFRNHTIITKNGKQFDIPFIFQRYALTRRYLQGDRAKKLTNFKHIDLQEVTSRRVSLQQMAEILGCENKSGHGENAIKLARRGRWKDLAHYCMQDVRVTEQVYLALKKLKVIR